MHIEEVNLKHELTDAEMSQLARKQSQALGRKAASESELAAIKKDFAGRIALAQAEVQNCSQAITTGWEMRNIRCILIDERPEGYRLVVRTDNGHVARRRKLEPEERQMKLGDQTEPRPLIASALLPVDDQQWEADMTQVPLYEDEVEELKKVKPPISFLPITGTHRQIEGNGPTNNSNKAEKRRRKK